MRRPATERGRPDAEQQETVNFIVFTVTVTTTTVILLLLLLNINITIKSRVHTILRPLRIVYLCPVT